MALTQVAIALLGTTFVISIIHDKWRHKQQAQKLGCKPLPRAPARDPLAITSALDMIQADKEKRVPQMLEDKVEEMTKKLGKYTPTYRLRKGFGENLVTFDPKNIQAILATQFKEFCVGAEREQCMGPLLGAGIVSLISKSFVGGVSIWLSAAQHRSTKHQFLYPFVLLNLTSSHYHELPSLPLLPLLHYF